MSTTLNKKTVENTNGNSKGWKYSLWSLQILLAIAFGMAGLMKLSAPISQMAESMSWVTTVPEILVRFIGLAEFSGALGLIIPSATRIKPSLTPLAALGLVTVMILASLLHISRSEFGNLPVNFVLGSLAALIAYGRTKKEKIEIK